MGLIREIRRPETVEELREAVALLLNDFCGVTATVERQNHICIEYRDATNLDRPVNAYVIIADADIHPEAYGKSRLWRDDITPEFAEEYELKLRKA